jgi:hypothetical protein
MGWNAKGPTVLQCLTFWMMSSVGVKGEFEIPEVGDGDIGWTEPCCRLWDLIQTNKPATDALWRLGQEEEGGESGVLFD